ncbi:PREDICTED: opsin, ultraviolet-sensitive-like isoform X1 [Papilio polytes]|uniref:opsin, ultraviolet-sensitive-like isoform X1 n=1 Tax=Papilio polytes TaxID=76194 RepID=UPI00067653AE|nr:PREDICTED: opsin, ultraviolet-sensitive-like isoform X1 [Papilio polytes]
MSLILKLVVIIIPIIVRCGNISNISELKDSKEINYVYEHNNTMFDLREYNQSVILSPFKCQSDFLWRCSNKLKQWKKRRRIKRFFVEESFSNIRKRSLHESITYSNVSNISMIDTDAISLALIARFKEKWPIHLWKENGWFSDEYLFMINPHWLRFSPPPPVIHYTLASIYIAILVTGCFGNIMVLYMYCRCRTLRTAGNILVANLALSDFIMLAKTPIFIFNSFNLGPALGKTGCVIYGFLGGLTGTTSIATLTAIALDRYWAVVRPLEPLTALTAVRARMLAVGAWIYAAIFSAVPALDIGYGHYVPEGYLTSCSFDYLTEDLGPRYFIFAFFCGAWLLPFCTIFFCYTSILQVVVCKRNMSSKNQEQRLSSRHVKEQTKRKAEIKLALLVIIVIALFFISWTPYAIVALLGIFGKKNLITPTASMIPALFCKTAACINPFIYIITHPKFRKELQKIIYRDKSKRMSGTLRTTGYYTDSSKMHRPSKDFSDTDVEILEMKDIPFRTGLNRNTSYNLETISSRISERDGSQRSASLKSFEESVVSPPSWYTKPQFSKKRSFQRRSSQRAGQ